VTNQRDCCQLAQHSGASEVKEDGGMQIIRKGSGRNLPGFSPLLLGLLPFLAESWPRDSWE
jgi:hypothetical protein